MSEGTVLEELVGKLRAVLVPYFEESDPDKYVGLFGDGGTYFDPNSSGKVSGDALLRHFEGFRGQIPPLDYEILNPQVQLAGEAAVLTLNLTTFTKTDGAVVSRWNTTQVHRRTGDGWEMLHAHWSLIPPAD